VVGEHEVRSPHLGGVEVDHVDVAPEGGVPSQDRVVPTRNEVAFQHGVLLNVVHVNYLVDVEGNVDVVRFILKWRFG